MPLTRRTATDVPETSDLLCHELPAPLCEPHCGVYEFFKKPMGIGFDFRRPLHELDKIEPALSRFRLRDNGLRHLEAFGELLLREAGRLPRLPEQAEQTQVCSGSSAFQRVGPRAVGRRCNSEIGLSQYGIILAHVGHPPRRRSP